MDTKKTQLFWAMRACGRYDDDEAIIETIQEMQKLVEDGEDPEEILRDEGFEPDYIFDLLP